MFLPLIFLIVFRKRIDFDIERKDKLYLLCYIVLIPLGILGYRLYINTKKDTTLSIYDLYYNINNNDLNIQNLELFLHLNLIYIEQYLVLKIK